MRILCWHEGETMRIKISRKLLILILVLIVVVVYLLAVCLPYKKQGGVLPKTREAFRPQDYCRSTIGYAAG